MCFYLNRLIEAILISTHNIHCTIFNIKKKITLNIPKSAAMRFCSKGLKKEFRDSRGK